MKLGLSMRTLLALLTVLMAGSAATAGEIVDVAEVRAAMQRGAILWDVRNTEAYAQGHIAGAVNIGLAAAVLRNPNTEDFLPIGRVQELLGTAGIDLSREVVVYGRRGDPSVYWALTAVKHFGGKQGRVFHGGLDAWQAAGLPLSKEGTRLAAVKQTLRIDPSVQVYLPEVLAKVGNPNVQFVDTREPTEFNGDVVKALRGGHIPGALNIPFERNWVDPTARIRLAQGDAKAWDGMVLKSPAQLKSLYAGLDPRKETIVYCQSGVRASETAWVLVSLGFQKVRVFEESWLGYGNDLSAPAEDVQFVNVGALGARIKRLEAAVRELTGELEALGKSM
jgi:thiosulfate/3-mercaptopyruvate sulfurtransferase